MQGDLVAASGGARQLVLGSIPRRSAPFAPPGPGSFLRRYTEVLIAAHGLVGFVKFQSAFSEAFGAWRVVGPSDSACEGSAMP
jgi:hypothetical protein